MFLVVNKNKIISILVLMVAVVSVVTAIPSGDLQANANVDKLLPIYNVDMQDKKIALTINCAWENTDIDKIVDTLKKYNAKATFFVIGDNLTEEKISYMKRAIEEGHIIGLHTYSHDYNKIYSSVTDFLSDYDKLRQVLLETLNYSPTIFRFPGGSYCSYGTCIREALISEMTRRGYTYYDWNVSAEDSVGTVTAHSIHKNIFPKVYEYSSPVILMHDSASNRLTAELLPDIIEELQANGYSFDTLELREPLHFGE